MLRANGKIIEFIVKIFRCFIFFISPQMSINKETLYTHGYNQDIFQKGAVINFAYRFMFKLQFYCLL
jgi:hypothetical protein